MNAILSLFLVMTPVPSVGPIYEEIRLTDDLVIRDEYLPLGAQTGKEGMLLSVEDFVVISNELEFSGTACDSRINALTQAQTQQIDDMMARCERQFSTVSLELEQAKLKVSTLENSLKVERTWNRFYSWVTIGLGSVLLGTGVYIILDK